MASIVAPSACVLANSAVWENAEASLAGSGYEVKVPSIPLVSLNSLMFSALARQCDLVILNGEYFHDLPASALREYVNAVGEARAHGCNFIIVGLKSDRIDSLIGKSAIVYLREFAALKETVEEALALAARRLDAEHQKKTDALEEGRHVRIADAKGNNTVELRVNDFFYSLPVMSSLAVPHPFDGDRLSDKLRFILGYSNDGYVAVCGVTRDEQAPTVSGYVVAEDQLDMPEGWRKDWQYELMRRGMTAYVVGDWKFVWPSVDAEPDLMIVGDEDFRINGRVVVQRTPFCLCTLVKPEELEHGVV